MSDFKVRYVEATMAASSLTVVATLSPALGSVNSSFLMPVNGRISAGQGRTSGSYNNAWLGVGAVARLTDTTHVTFADTGVVALNNRCSALCIEYIGPSGGSHEIILRGQVEVTLTDAVDTQKDSSAIANIGTLSKCVPFMFYTSSDNSSSMARNHAVAQMVNASGSNVVRVNRAQNNGTATCVIFVVEFVGSAWSVQQIDHQFAASATNENDSISVASSVQGIWTYSQLLCNSGGNTPATVTYYVYPSSATNLVSRIITKSATGQTARTWVIHNNLLNVQRFGTPDGVDDLTAAGSDPESVNFTVSAVTNIQDSFATCYMGASLATTTDNLSVLWFPSLVSQTLVALQRCRSVGNTEYVIQVASLSGLTSPALPSVGAVTIAGLAPQLQGHLKPNVGAVTIAGLAPQINEHRTVTPALAALSIEGTDFHIRLFRDTFVGQLTLAGLVPVATAMIFPSLGAVRFSYPAAAGLVTTDEIAPGVGSVAMVGQVPVEITILSIAIPPAVYPFASFEPGTPQGGNIGIVEPDCANLPLIGYQYLRPAEVQEPDFVISIAGLAPTLDDFHQTIEPEPALILIGAQAPPRARIRFRWIDDEHSPALEWM